MFIVISPVEVLGCSVTNLTATLTIIAMILDFIIFLLKKIGGNKK